LLFPKGIIGLIDKVQSWWLSKLKRRERDEQSASELNVKG